eukprot:g236.t1
MVNFSNAFSSSRSGTSLAAIEPELNTGDVLLFARTGPDTLLAKLGPWHNASSAGFLIREKEGIEGLRLCHPKLSSDPAQGNTELTSLDQFLTESAFHTVVVRKLWQPLESEQEAKVLQFSQDSVGKLLNRKVTLLMQRSDIPSICIYTLCLHFWPMTVERFICSELVVKMLMNVGRIDGAYTEYYPIQPDSNDIQHLKIYGPSIFVRTPVVSTALLTDNFHSVTT